MPTRKWNLATLVAVLLAVVATVVAVMPAQAIDDTPIPAGGFYDGSAAATALTTTTATITAAYQARDGVQFDATRAGTNTVPSAFTPRYVGDLLVGMNGATNKLFAAVTATTNGWVQITP